MFGNQWASVTRPLRQTQAPESRAKKIMEWRNLTEKREKLRAAVRNGEIRNILMIRAQKIGDMITFLPVIQAIYHHFPDSKITLACRKAGLPIAERIPFVSTVDVDELHKNASKYSESFDLLIPSSGDPEWVRLKRTLRIPFAVAVLPETLTGICLKHRLQFYFLFDDVARYSEDTHEVHRNLKIQDFFGPPPNSTVPMGLRPGKATCPDAHRRVYIAKNINFSGGEHAIKKLGSGTLCGAG